MGYELGKVVDRHITHVQKSLCFRQLHRVLKQSRAITRAVFYATEDS